MEVQNFSYNGFCGRTLKGKASYTAEFKEWTADPGIAICICSDGEERLIPSFALIGFDYSKHPQQFNEGKEFYIGKPCHS